MSVIREMLCSRLLKEMGWTEEDEEEYVITEDEKKEMQKNIQRVSCKKLFQVQYMSHYRYGHMISVVSVT